MSNFKYIDTIGNEHTIARNYKLRVANTATFFEQLIEQSYEQIMKLVKFFGLTLVLLFYPQMKVVFIFH